MTAHLVGPILFGMTTVIALSREKLREAREATGLSQVEAAEAAGIARATLQNAEAGKFTPRADALARLAALYGVTLDSLFVHGPDGTSDAGPCALHPAQTAAPAASSARESAAGASTGG